MNPAWKPYTLLFKNEIEVLQQAALEPTKGWVVIAGTFKGGDAMAIREAAPKRKILVIDSFEGLDDPVPQDQHKECPIPGKHSAGGIERYKQNFIDAGYKLPDMISKMWISLEKLSFIRSRKIALLWLDLDRYQPTLDCLQYFGKMMSPNGIIMTHDYFWHRTPGIKKACAHYGGTWTKVVSSIARYNKDN